jgi:integrase
MGPRLKLPRYVHGFVDRHGKPRFYFRRAGFDSVALPGLPYSPAFMKAYETSLAGQRSASPRVASGTMDALALSYFCSPEFCRLKRSTQRARRWTIERFCREHGHRRAAEMRRIDVVRQMARLAAKPGAANALRMALREMMKHAVAIGIRADDPTRDVKAIRIRSPGHHTWTEVEIAAFAGCHPVGSRGRLALALLLYTGQRRGDVIRMGTQHVRDGVLSVKQEKTGIELAIPIHADLERALAASSSGHLTFLTTKYDRPFTAIGFSNWFRHQCDAAGLPHCSAHGLRKAAARRLAEAGCTPHEIGAITGHVSLAELARYTKAVDQRRLAEVAMAKTRTSIGKPGRRFAKNGGKVLRIKARI